MVIVFSFEQLSRDAVRRTSGQRVGREADIEPSDASWASRSGVPQEWLKPQRVLPLPGRGQAQPLEQLEQVGLLGCGQVRGRA